MLWPAERRLQLVLTPTDAIGHPAGESLERDAATMARAAVAVLVLLVAGVVLMVAQP